jgi:hypothetical protein
MNRSATRDVNGPIFLSHPLKRRYTKVLPRESEWTTGVPLAEVWLVFVCFRTIHRGDHTHPLA